MNDATATILAFALSFALLLGYILRAAVKAARAERPVRPPRIDDDSTPRPNGHVPVVTEPKPRPRSPALRE